MLKDVDLYLAAANENGLVTRTLVGIHDVLEGAITHGHDAADYLAVYEEINPYPYLRWDVRAQAAYRRDL